MNTQEALFEEEYQRVRIVSPRSVYNGRVGTQLPRSHPRVRAHAQEDWVRYWDAFVVFAKDDTPCGFMDHEIESAHD
jgi:hypothetical protein